MENFTFWNPTRIEFGIDKEKEIGKHLEANGIKKVLLAYGSERIKKDGLFDTVAASLKAHNIAFVELGGIVSNPLLSKVYEGISVAKAHNVDAILAVGGGSVLDSSKAIAAGALTENDVWDFFLGKATVEKALPIFDIITLAATGSEMNHGAVITNDATHQKYFIQAPALFPKVSIINPQLQSSVSKEYLVYSASDVIAHCIEGYFTATTHPLFISKQIEVIITTVMETTEKLLENPNDDEARGEFAWAATCALNGLTHVGVAGIGFPNHMIEHAISAMCNIPHGAGLSIVMPAWMKWYRQYNETQFTRFATTIFGQKSAEEGIEALEAWFRKIGTPTKFSEYGIEEKSLPVIIENAVDNAHYFGMEKVYTKEVIAEILKNAL
ncbi:iron-containing alcohol dehydrogenase [Sulfurospirillum barnesii]|uniref:Fe-dependent oxidoreductase, alcohol dehydrogenase n=1 Tax=Sulfurospirillum barnesii (strain ATCC 700032 / DSM 10660 / SES-3) TaxID=760154 RepID=I3XWS6_SULBS|nr:iron-containing alcohol dehydrogenase [Sulfurospirillum barnesii]AFL68400.1 Fe-dependent oxidoreductase, alcohol dehydrogenase [Sulfurospirillum barnesii SES-3]